MSQETIQENATQEAPQVTPVFEEVKNISADDAVNILIQAAMAAQQTGSLSVRDSVLLASAINVVRPGTI
jgi:hypothetical protein